MSDHQMLKQQALDQYFTTNTLLKQCVKECIQNKSDSISKSNTKEDIILEPSAGQGDLIFKEFNYCCVELDANLIPTLQKFQNVKCAINADFLKDDFLKDNCLKDCCLKEQLTSNQKFKTIIGNPPFTQTLPFIDKCLELLDDEGELIFIVPFNTFQLTSSKQILRKMQATGQFTHFIQFNDEHLFKNASVQVCVFRFVRTQAEALKQDLLKEDSKENSQQRKLLYCEDYLTNPSFKECCYKINNILTISSKTTPTQNMFESLTNIFSIHVGYVCGAEKILKVDDSNNTKYPHISILKEKGTVKHYYDFQNKNDLPEWIYTYKEQLMNRKIKSFNENNWFEFGLKRNEQLIKRNLNKACLYVYNQTRKQNRNQEVCFISTVQPFGGNLIMLLPKKDMTQNELKFYQQQFQNDLCQQFVHCGKFQISYRLLNELQIQKFDHVQKQLSNNSTIQSNNPTITFNNHNITQIMDNIVEYISSLNIIFKKIHEDGRVNSSQNEQQVLNMILPKFPFLKVPSVRAAYDIYFEIENQIIPINIKTTKGGQADNSGNFYQLVQSFTNYTFTKEQAKLNRTKLYKILEEKLYKKEYNDNLNKDYYYLVLMLDDENKVTKVFWNQLLCLQTLTYNANNLPFQINWSLNQQRQIYPNILHNMKVYLKMISLHKKKRQLTAIEQLERLENIVEE